MALRSLVAKLLGKDRKDPRNFLLGYLPRDAVCAEIGVWKGAFSELVLRSGKVAEYTLIDPYEFMPEYPNRMYGGKVAKSQGDMDRFFEQAKARIASYPGKKNWVRARSDKAAASIATGTLDFLDIDGNHYYAGVMADLEHYHTKMKVGGCIVLDDWAWRDDDGKLAVKLATCDYLSRHAGTLQVIEVRNGQAVLLVIDNLGT